MPHILVAEDDPSSANVLRTVLQRAGYVVTVTSDGAETLRRLELHGPPDLLLLDWMLPEVSGLEVCHRVRRRWDPLELPVLMVTARADAESISAAFDAGASDYLTKPYLGAELRARVAAHLRTKRLVDEQRRIEEHLREREKLSSLGLLVSGVAHDLNNPLAGISGFTQLLLSSERDPERREDLGRILDETERCRRMVAGLLSFARRTPPERCEIDLSLVLRETFEMREQHLLSRGIDASFLVDADLPPILGDAHQLQQVFLNIILNAEHALQECGRTLRVSASAGPDRDVDPKWVCLEFFNDGPPIPDDVLEHIFSPFYTTKPKDEGTGLGLAICERILREHGGEVQAVSDAAGTAFRITLPVYLEAVGTATVREGSGSLSR
jgi:two-component system, NtrC family, sensor kinase